MERFVKAEAAGKSVIYTDITGRYFRFFEGTWAWRNNNPGNLVSGSVSKRNNQIGAAGGFAVFPDREAGHLALLDLLSSIYFNKSIDEVVKVYAPPQDHNNVLVYTKFLREKTGVHDDKKIKDFTPNEFEKLWQSIELMEGSEAGKVVEIYKITQAYRNRYGIYAYKINGVEWNKKEGCISLMKEGKLDLVLCCSHSGNLYLRSRKNSSIQGNLQLLIAKEPKI